jgi:arylsulfatase A-like enzyme
MNRSTRAILVLVVAALAVAVGSAEARPPNVVVILADDLGWADLGCYGSRYHETPHIDRLAASGMRFTDAYSAGSNCTPTRAALLSGQYAPRTGVYTVGPTRRWDTSRQPLVPVENREHLPAATATIADVLKAAGYATGLFGKWHLDDTRDHPSGRGFAEALIAGGIVQQGHFAFRTRPPVDVPAGAYLADFLTDKAVDFIARHRDGPFFLYLPHFAVHSPFEAKPELIARFAAKAPVGDQKSPVYAAMLASLDESVGRIVAALAEAGVADDTLVILTSDNGGLGGYAREGLPCQEITDNRPLRGGKAMLFEGGIRVPFIAAWPHSIRPGTTCAEPVISVDLLPTLAAAAGAPLPEQPIDGVDLGPLFAGGCGQPLDRGLYWHAPGYLGAGEDHAARDTWRSQPAGAIRAGRHKLIEHFEDGRLELYDLVADVGETRDLAAAEPAVAAKLAAQLVAWRERLRAPMPARRQPAAAATAAPPAPSRRPNVLFIAVDDLRPELGCYGRAAIRSPHIDRLAARGTLFERAYCMVPVCGASRASLMTGIRPTPTRFLAHDTTIDRDAPHVTPLHEHFRNHAYRTSSLGKVLHVVGDAAAGWSVPDWRPDDVPWYAEPANSALHRERSQRDKRFRGPPWEAADKPDDGYMDAVIATRAVTELERLAKGGPFFLAVGFIRPHLPFVAPKKYWDLYDPAAIELPDHRHPPTDVPRAALTTWNELRYYAGMPDKGPLTDEQARQLIHGYRASVSFVDAQIGRLLDALDRLGLADDTIVVLWGDHGWNLGEHGLWCKHVCYETAMRVPLVVVAPGQPGGGKARGLVELIDIYPSLCDLAGLPLPHHLEGASFAPLLADPALPGRPAAVGRFGSGDTIRTDRHRLADYTGPKGVAAGRMLFDHEADPDERANLAAREEARDLASRLSAELRDRRSRIPGPAD